MNECCATCKNKYMIARNNYRSGGCKTDFLEGYICMAFANEGIASWMVGLDPETGMCECYERRKNDTVGSMEDSSTDTKQSIGRV